MAFRVKLADATDWRNMLTAVSALVDEAVFNADSEGVKVKAMDPSHVALVDLEWKSTAFEEYVCDKPVSVGINLREMLKLLRRTGSDESLDLSFDEEAAKLVLKLSGKYVRTFSMSTLDLVGEEIPSVKVAFNAKARITTACLSRTVEDAATVSDNIKFEAKAEGFNMKASGDLGSFTVELNKETEALVDLQVKEESSATYSLNFLSEIVKAASTTSETVSIEFSSNIPLKLDFELLQGKLQYLIAPYIE